VDYKLEAMCLAATEIDAMRAFYAGVFGIAFEAHEIEGGHIFAGTFAGLELVLVPASLSGVTTGQNPTHYDIYVPDIHAAIELVEKHGGKTNQRLGEDEHEMAIGVFDPDGNFMVFKQRKTPPAG
jgi:predicted enzyme related to lactoylglutathione lyase